MMGPFKAIDRLATDAVRGVPGANFLGVSLCILMVFVFLGSCLVGMWLFVSYPWTIPVIVIGGLLALGHYVTKNYQNYNEYKRSHR